MWVRGTRCWNAGAVFFFFLRCLNFSQTTQQVIHSERADSNEAGCGRMEKCLLWRNINCTEHLTLVGCNCMAWQSWHDLEKTWELGCRRADWLEKNITLRLFWQILWFETWAMISGGMVILLYEKHKNNENIISLSRFQLLWIGHIVILIKFQLIDQPRCKTIKMILQLYTHYFPFFTFKSTKIHVRNLLTDCFQIKLENSRDAQVFSSKAQCNSRSARVWVNVIYLELQPRVWPRVRVKAVCRE